MKRRELVRHLERLGVLLKRARLLQARHIVEIKRRAETTLSCLGLVKRAEFLGLAAGRA